MRKVGHRKTRCATSVCRIAFWRIPLPMRRDPPSSALTGVAHLGSASRTPRLASTNTIDALPDYLKNAFPAATESVQLIGEARLGLLSRHRHRRFRPLNKLATLKATPERGVTGTATLRMEQSADRDRGGGSSGSLEFLTSHYPPELAVDLTCMTPLRPMIVMFQSFWDT